MQLTQDNFEVAAIMTVIQGNYSKLIAKDLQRHIKTQSAQEQKFDNKSVLIYYHQPRFPESLPSAEIHGYKE